MLMVLNDIFVATGRRKIRYLLFFFQMVIIFLAVSYCFNRFKSYLFFSEKVRYSMEKGSNIFLAYQDPKEDAFPDCDYQGYQRFVNAVNDICKDTSFSFGESDICLRDFHVPDRFDISEGGPDKLYQLTYVTDNFFSFYDIRLLSGSMFDLDPQSAGDASHIPVILGYAYRKYYKPGDVIDGKYLVTGVLEKGSAYFNTAYDTVLEKLDEQILMPMEYQAEEWGGCYVNHMHYEATDENMVEKIDHVMKEYGFEGYHSVSYKERLKVLREAFLEEMLFMGFLLFIMLFMCVLSMVSMLLHLIEEQKTEFSIHMLCGASRYDICVRFALPVLVMVFSGLLPSAFVYRSLILIGADLVFLAAVVIIILAIPVYYWLSQPISELKKERE